MKSNYNPYFLVIITSFVILLTFTLTFTLTSYIIYKHIDIKVYLLSGFVVLLTAYLSFSFILKKFIYDKIKIIYKTIHTLKLPKGSKNKRIDLQEDIISNVSDDVASWANQHRLEVEELKRMETYRREFLGNVSHELKTPIFNMQGYVLTLLEGALDDPNVNKEYLQKTERNIERMINIVQDLEIISRLESGEITLQQTRFDILSLTREIFEMLEIKAQQRNIRLTFNNNVASDSHIYVHADKEKIRQVLINLTENSIKYGKEGGRTKVSFYDMDENILVEVSDNGIGIHEKDIPRLFERFYRVDKSRSRNQGGSGLGLSIVKHIIESHKQTVNVRSAPGVGSTFSFTITKG
jgi:two-component system phosphate regulon sensor histidine kinase PhoR